MKNKIIKDYLCMIIGALLIGVGCCFVVEAALGADSLTTFEQGWSKTLHLDLALCQFGVNMVFLAILLFIDKTKVSTATVLCPFVIPMGLKLAYLFVPTVSGLVIRGCYLIVGIVIIGAGIGVGAQSPSGNNPYDGLVIALSEKLKFSYSILRPILDAAILIFGIVLGGTWGVGTVVATLFQGTVANFFIREIGKIVK